MVHSQHCYWSGGPWTCKSLSGKREKGHSGPKLKSMVLMSQGRKVTYEWHMFLSFFILLVSPWYMYKGSCFRDVCADTVVVGGYFRGSTGVYIYIYISLSLSIHIHSISFFRGQVKRVLSVNHVLSRTCKFNWALWKFRVLTQHFRERCFQPQARAWELCFKP